MNRYILLYIKQIANRNLLYITENYTQYVVIAYKGKESEKQYTHTHTHTFIYIYNMNHFAVCLKLTVLQFKKKELKAIWTFSSSASRVYCLPTSICPSSSPSSCPLDASWPEPLPACCLGAAWLLLAGDAWSLTER